MKPFNMKCECGKAWRVYAKPNHLAFPKNPFGFAMSKAPVEMVAKGTFVCTCGVRNETKATAA